MWFSNHIFAKCLCRYTVFYFWQNIHAYRYITMCTGKTFICFFLAKRLCKYNFFYCWQNVYAYTHHDMHRRRISAFLM